MGFNRSIGYMGVAIQTAKGSPAAAAQFKFPVYSGGIAPSVRFNEDELSTALRAQGDPYIEGVEVAVELETRAYVGSSVMFMQAVLGTRSTAGASDPYTHTISTGTPTYLTFWHSIGPSDAVCFKASDVRLDTVDWTWSGPGAVRLNVKGMGTAIDATAGDFDASAIDETDGDGYFTTVGGTFQWDAVGSTLATVVTPSGGIRFANNMTPVLDAAAVAAYDHDEGKLHAGFDLTANVADLEDYIEILTAAVDGSALTGDVQFGKVNLAFTEYGAGTHTATFTASRVPWQVEPVTIDASATGTELSLTGNARYNTTESDALDVAITNANAGTVYAAAT
jgi:hypothetical protein